MRILKIFTVLAAGVLALSFGQANADTVDCDKEGHLLQDRIDKAHIGETIKILGKCDEQITIKTDHLRLVGVGGATIDGGADGSLGNSVVVVNALGVQIVGLTITGGRNGIVVDLGGSAIIGENSPGSGNTIEAVGRNGILVIGGGFAQIDNNIVTDAGRHGIIVSGGGARLANNDVRRSAREGLFVSTSRVNLEGPNTFLDNTRRGILCNQLGALRVTAIQTLVDLVPPITNNGLGGFSNFGCSVTSTVAFP